MKKNGLIFGVLAYGIWGLFPIYWKLLHQIDAVQLIAHRIAWSFIILIGVVFITRQWGALRPYVFNVKVLRIYFVAAILIGINWLVYVWAVNSGAIIESSLGYFINPLISVMMGVIVFKERLRLFQWLSIILAACGVLYLTIMYGRLPWIALTLALSFGGYGLVKKMSPLGSLFGLTLETGILFIPAVIYLGLVNSNGSGAFLHSSMTTNLLLMGAGVVTTVPLLMFSSAAQNIPLTMVGLLQYITPTLQFLLGVLVYKEVFDRTQFVGFGIVWMALLLFIFENFWHSRVGRLDVPIPETGQG